MTNNFSGKYAEFLARLLFRFKGFSILQKNYKTGKGTHAGEIDFIAKKGKLIVFVEVKKRKTLEDASYAIKEAQQQRITNGAKAFLKHNPCYQNCDCRFDAVLVKLPLSIKHLKNAW
ncbi:MAG: YraN family protein [Alphaproteobacteria bacterium]|nr:YraN family protein [Alphaproteobacteria bacterium]